jgi:menaquinol-cytochrome c reductase iron-sulfur subunit
MQPPEPTLSTFFTGRRRLLVAFVNTTVGVLGAGLSALLAAFALRPTAVQAGGRWVRAGTTEDLKPDVPIPRVLSVPRVDGWYRERARQTVFIVWDGSRNVRALSATCTHLGCQVQWDSEAGRFKCPCHGGMFDAAGRVVGGPPPRPLDTVEARLSPADGSVLVRL